MHSGRFEDTCAEEGLDGYAKWTTQQERPWSQSEAVNYMFLTFYETLTTWSSSRSLFAKYNKSQFTKVSIIYYKSL